MIERANIFAHTKTILRSVPGVKLVTRRDWRSVIGSLKQYPAIVITDLGSKQLDRDSGRNIDWALNMGIVAIVKGKTEESAPEDLEAFQTEIEKVLHGQMFDCDDVGDILPQYVSPLVLLKEAGGKVAVQGIGYLIRHYEDIAALIA